MNRKHPILSNMDANYKKAMKSRIKKVMENLEKNNMQTAYVDTKEEALTLVKTLLNDKTTTASGGSLTLDECGVSKYIKTNTDFKEDPREAYFVDYYFSSANAITEQGEIYQVDGRSNRTSAILFGPNKVVLIVGVNKVVLSVRDAVERVKLIAAPSNAIRLCKDTPCAKRGECISPKCSTDSICTIGCNSTERICCNYVIMSKQREKNRILVIFVGEDCGY